MNYYSKSGYIFMFGIFAIIIICLIASSIPSKEYKISIKEMWKVGFKHFILVEDENGKIERLLVSKGQYDLLEKNGNYMVTVQGMEISNDGRRLLSCKEVTTDD